MMSLKSQFTFSNVSITSINGETTMLGKVEAIRSVSETDEG